MRQFGGKRGLVLEKNWQQDSDSSDDDSSGIRL